MSQTESKIKLIFEGAERGVGSAAARAKAAIKSVTDEEKNFKKLEKAGDKVESVLMGIGKGLLAVSAAGSAASVIGGVAAAATQASGALLLIPGALAAIKIGLGAIDMGAGDFLASMGNLNNNKAFKKNMEAMGDSAKHVAGQIKIAHDQLAEGLGEKMFAGIEAKLKPLIASTLPQLKASYDGIAVSVNRTGLELLDFLNQSNRQADLNNLIKDSGAIWDQLLASVVPLSAAFLDVAVVGADALKDMTSGTANAAEGLADYVAGWRRTGQIRKWIDGGVQALKDMWHIVENVGSTVGSVFRGLGVSMGSPLAMLRDLTQRMSDFMKSAGAQEGLHTLGEALKTIGQVVGWVAQTALTQLAKTLVALAPVAETVAKTFGVLLVGALNTVGPIIRTIADVLAEFPAITVVATTALVGFVVAIKAIKAVNAVSELLSIGTAIGKTGAAADGAAAKTGLFAGKLGLLKGLGAGLVVATVAVELDKVNVAAAGGAEKLGLFQGQLHGIVGAAGMVASGDVGGIFADISEDIDTMVMKFKTAQSPIGEFFHWLSGQKPDPIPVGVDTKPGEGGVREFVGGVSRQRAALQIDGDVDPVTGKITQSVKLADGSTGVITVDGEPSPVNGKINASIRFANGSTGTIDLDADHRRADGKILATVHYANGQTAQILVNAATGQALHDIAALTQTRYMSVIAVVRQRALPPGHTAATGGAVIGGSIVRGFAPGGPVSGPGTGTSDSVPAMLSNGEYVATARQVDNAGGPAAFGRLMAALDQGRVPGFASGGGVGDMVKWGSVSAKVWNQLLAQGWKGRAGDNQEALYRPVAKALAPTTKSLGEVAKKLGDVVRWGQVTTAKWDALIAAGWKGRAGDSQEALYRPAVKTGLSGAIGELASRLAEGGSVFEDLSFRGMSSNLGKYNDQLADMFYKQNSGFDVEALAGWLRKQQGSASSSSGSGGGTFQLVVGPGADAAAGAFIAGLVRTGKLQLKAA